MNQVELLEKRFRKILIIDDQPIIGMAMDMLLKQEIPNIEIEHVEGGEKGLNLLRKTEYDLVLLDVHLPEYSVFDLIPLMRKIQKNVKILVFTASPEKEIMERVNEMNVKGFIAKKVSKTETLTAVKTVLNGGRYFSKNYS